MAGEAKQGIIDGRAISKQIEAELTEEIASMKADDGMVPGLATILVGQDPASQLYVRLKHKACDRVGIYAEDQKLDASITQKELLDRIKNLNTRADIHGILLQLPLPQHLDAKKAMQAIDPAKDVDGFHPYNMGNLMIGDEGFVPCTPAGIIRALEYYDVDIEGKDVVIVGHSNVVGKPMAAMFLNRNATVAVCHVYTKDLKSYTAGADILVVAAGVKHLIKEDMVKKGAVVFDAGITEEEGKIYGDVDFENVVNKASFITPVPGGVGPMTIATLLTHVTFAAKKIE
ncbi:MAG: methylenetetrahydrofolate dehydrogenase (NADP+) / methenyltetrahydrofolate cyclohydrolase [Methanohalophilus sp. T328-1]|jgi:methylenetetrahydrofolate dehydrogenase (NADP+)/methenyltetrahydrofolate cyclohydrolase|uniref:tetrahydrofolate dehydrogenase/cyclohydrolase catalytic domain-containing protein n=1 Tax=unclassified Methanohalophilus TaxID=2636082 RepID=UPI0007932C60|nr:MULTISPECIES: tetrahydrofolate dehydrogenase/cyclohydrolase catalytic domain-containing protein [unclassified Methanohalophilus]KXS40988.1 MAG: methylenetetrahydrofolate dehydrogenase (NADP+) / methenyltetrahydrofolate cyclohydrolase [Methanohalophilus sp. T328-1]OBZ35026.1 MAG: bifunctional methylenetetrahydrofolate dehydrogenase/methenyltetrahydrofolate cyclohydrolase [Methanohalophilus sp. DAL1]RXG33458.1 methylenetetrahydrofolate dehydrogenase (NADP+) / methenyltetrahydrofolate cyclohydro